MPPLIGPRAGDLPLEQHAANPSVQTLLQRHKHVAAPCQQPAVPRPRGRTRGHARRHRDDSPRRPFTPMSSPQRAPGQAADPPARTLATPTESSIGHYHGPYSNVLNSPQIVQGLNWRNLNARGSRLLISLKTSTPHWRSNRTKKAVNALCLGAPCHAAIGAR